MATRATIVAFVFAPIAIPTLTADYSARAHTFLEHHSTIEITIIDLTELSILTFQTCYENITPLAQSQINYEY